MLLITIGYYNELWFILVVIIIISFVVTAVVIIIVTSIFRRSSHGRSIRYQKIHLNIAVAET